MDRDTERWTNPELSEVEAMAIVAAIGRPRATYGLRFSARAKQWLASRFDHPLIALEQVTEALDRALDGGPDAVRAVEFELEVMEVMTRAMFNVLTDAEHGTGAVFYARFGVDHARMQQLRTALQLERGITEALATTPDLVAAERIDPMIAAARAMRVRRGSRCDGLDLTTAPELRLLGDAYRIAQGRDPLGSESLDAAWDAFAASERQHAGLGNEISARSRA